MSARSEAPALLLRAQCLAKTRGTRPAFIATAETPIPARPDERLILTLAHERGDRVTLTLKRKGRLTKATTGLYQIDFLDPCEQDATTWTCLTFDRTGRLLGSALGYAEGVALVYERYLKEAGVNCSIAPSPMGTGWRVSIFYEGPRTPVGSRANLRKGVLFVGGEVLSLEDAST